MADNRVNRNVIDYATLAVSSGAVDLVADASPSITAASTVREAIITFETDQVRWRADGTAPTSSVGHLMNIGDVLNFTGANYEEVLKAIQFIRVTADADVAITYFD